MYLLWLCPSEWLVFFGGCKLLITSVKKTKFLAKAGYIICNIPCCTCHWPYSICKCIHNASMNKTLGKLGFTGSLPNDLTVKLLSPFLKNQIHQLMTEGHDCTQIEMNMGFHVPLMLNNKQHTNVAISQMALPCILIAFFSVPLLFSPLF